MSISLGQNSGIKTYNSRKNITFSGNGLNKLTRLPKHYAEKIWDSTPRPVKKTAVEGAKYIPGVALGYIGIKTGSPILTSISLPLIAFGKVTGDFLEICKKMFFKENYMIAHVKHKKALASGNLAEQLRAQNEWRTVQEQLIKEVSPINYSYGIIKHSFKTPERLEKSRMDNLNLKIKHK
jgi:hypothetical protein